MLLSDRDIRAELERERIRLDPYEPAMLQPSAIDVRLDRYFRLFDNHKYPFIDPAEDQPELTHLIEVRPDEPFVLHPGEFVLGVDVRGGHAARRRRRAPRGQVARSAGSAC